MMSKGSAGRRILAWCVTLALLVSLTPGMALAEEKTAVSLEQAIRIIKDSFEVPPEYSNFTSGFSSFNDRQAWTLNWNAPGEPGGSFNAQVDSVTGEVLSMNTWKPENRPEPTPQKPAISAVEARQIATGLMRRLAAGHLSELQLMPDDNQFIPLTSYGPVVYTVRWQRMVNGVPFPENGVTIGINGEDGKPMSYYLNWSMTSLPSAAGAVPVDKAQQVFKDTGMMELQYFLAPAYRPLTTKEKQKVQLVYQLNHPSRGIIDAVTGEPLKTDDKWYGGGGADIGMELMKKQAMSSIPANTVLSPEELAEIEKAANLITQEEAVEAVRRWIEIPDGLPLRSAGMEADWMFPEIRIWSLHWSADRPEDGKIANISARVDAATGELMGFDRYYPSEESRYGNLDREAARKLAEEFLQKVQPQRFKEVEYDESYRAWTPVLEAGKNPPSQYYNYRRVVNSIPFPSNGMNVTVDAVSQQVTHYQLTWYKLDFPSSAGTMDREAAENAFLQNQPLTLMYTQRYGADGQNDIKLVYKPQPPAGRAESMLMDARSGEMLDWQGKPLSMLPRSRVFNDIEGSFAEEEINFLGQAGLFAEYGESFHPGENITAASLLRAMLQIKYGVHGNTDLTDEEVMKRARQYEWLKEDLHPGAAVSREMAARFAIRLLDLDRAARVEGIYKIPYSDARSLAPDSVGYVALAWGLNIMKGSGNYFRPEVPLTREAAAVVLVRSLEVKP